jgi:hypothetical protein
MQDWFNFVSEVGDSFRSVCSNSRKRKGLAYTPMHGNTSWSLCRIQSGT